METRFSQLRVENHLRSTPTFSIELWHDGLNKHRLIKGKSDSIVTLKATLQAKEWNQQWANKDGRRQEVSRKEQRKSIAAERTAAAQSELDCLSTLLAQTLTINDAVDWERLKDRAPFAEPAPTPEARPGALPPAQHPREPLKTDPAYQPSLGLLDRIFASRRERAIEAKRTLFETDHLAWQQALDEALKSRTEAEWARKLEVDRCDARNQQAFASWEGRRNEHLARQKQLNDAVDAKRRAYEAMDPSAITEYCDLVLSSSRYPDSFPQEYELDYTPETRTMLVSYALPAPNALATLKAVKYVAARDDFEEQHLTDTQSAKLYDEVLYQVTLRTIHELFEADTIGAIGTVVFNGIVTAIDPRTGKHVTTCVLSIRANRDEFLAIDLGKVDPKACFKALKGVGSSKLHGLVGVAPIMELRREDGRFVSAYEVANTLNDGVNLAAIDWQDFEHLIRELFEQEFSSSGGEVKVTRTSRDGGVDAIAFDPDPIRGGKIVIQAKRYTNTVSVGAVRDLYGTVHNEGAIKGILVTTSDYGPDSYSFAEGKPLVLMNGANLLHLLEKHGHRARIDLREAKQLA